MVIVQSKSRRKPSGARYKSKIIKKRQHLIGRIPAMTKVGALKKQKIRSRSDGRKLRLLNTDKVNLYDPKTKKYSIETIKNVVDSPSDKNFIRRNIMTKGAIISTSKGNAKVTSRPGQDGMVNAVLV
ncbi:MAG TPA: 30S ribosomal protein S8e [Alphaproteobacteria bacterium]|nr:30S ribosomal protein S8e [Alphaproteobacteria bacterium]